MALRDQGESVLRAWDAHEISRAVRLFPQILARYSRCWQRSQSARSHRCHDNR